LEWNSSLNVTVVDFEKAFDSVDHVTLWKTVYYYSVPEKFISLIKASYSDSMVTVVHDGELSDPFLVKTGVRQGCLPSPLLFLLVVDWVLRTTTGGARTGLQSTLASQLHDLDFADDIALLVHTCQHAQAKAQALASVAKLKV